MRAPSAPKFSRPSVAIDGCRPVSTRIAPALGWRIRKAGQGTVIAGLPVSSARSTFRVRKRPPGLSIIERDQVTCPATIGSTVTVAPGVPPASGS